MDEIDIDQWVMICLDLFINGHPKAVYSNLIMKMNKKQALAVLAKMMMEAPQHGEDIQTKLRDMMVRRATTVEWK